MITGKDKSKVMNIVKPNMLHFQEFQQNILQDWPLTVYAHQVGKLEVNSKQFIVVIFFATSNATISVDVNLFPLA